MLLLRSFLCLFIWLREGEGEGRPLAFAAVDGDGDFVSAGDFLNDRKAEAGAFARGVARVAEAVKDVRDFILRNANAFIDQGDDRCGIRQTQGWFSPRSYVLYSRYLGSVPPFQVLFRS